ncbi:MAG: hypothetical protein NTZ65_03665 [Candidatus Berkelbacteria bacterium]|nr:hypothetical protein [Candidatus Berkelbacteria bacterium]
MLKMGPALRAFGNTGQANDVDLALGRCLVTPAMLQRVVTDPTHCAAVAAAMRGEQPSSARFDDILVREGNVTQIICDYAEVEYPGNDIVEKALRMVQAKRGVVTIHDRFAPKIALPQLFNFFYRYNKVAEEEGRIPVKLWQTAGQENWRGWDAEFLPTETGVINCDFSQVMRATDITGRPFLLDMDQQMTWAKEQGGDGITSVEQITLLFIHSIIEFGRPLWGGGTVRCCNSCGSGDSLDVYWDADGGFGVGDWSCSDQDWNIGAVPRKCLVLGA